MSKKLLGQRLRLQVAAAVAECREEELYQEAVAARAGLKEVRVGEQLRHLAEAGLLHPLPRAGRRQPYARRNSVYWRMCRELREELLREEGQARGDG
jgi:hypothetical protein